VLSNDTLRLRRRRVLRSTFFWVRLDVVP